jgi:hypothetical protein
MKTSRAWAVLLLLATAGKAGGEEVNLVQNGDFKQRAGAGPAGYDIVGDVEYRYLGDPRRDVADWGIALRGNGRHGALSQVVPVDSTAGRWFRFTFRGLPQDHFAVAGDDLRMRVSFFGNHGARAYDAKGKQIYWQIEQDRRDFTTNGDYHVGGAAVWRAYQLDFWLPFPEVDTLKLSVEFGHGASGSAQDNEFFVTDFRLVRLHDAPVEGPVMNQSTTDLHPSGTLIPLGGRWFYEAAAGETAPPALFTQANADRLLYHDSKYSTPFSGNMATYLRAGDKDASGHVALQDVYVPDNVTVSFTADAMVIHTRGLPNHPTGKFPESGFGSQFNPNFIQEHLRTYYIPLNPKVNPRHIFTASDNSNHALPMGPIGIATNGVVFFNPFDANSQDASSLMDRCCGHPSPDNTYHYHKYPICVNSPWADEGKEHSPLIGWAFDGFPIYGPFESALVMAKDLTGSNALNNFNLHFDPQRGWHYHATPGKFPYIIGGYWGTEDPRDKRAGRPGPPGGGGGFGPPPSDFGPPPDAEGFAPPPPP